MFNNKILQLLQHYPLDRVSDNGTPFWSGAKKPPTPLIFDSSDPLHIEFIASVALMRSRMYGINFSYDKQIVDIAGISNDVDGPKFRYKEPKFYCAFIEVYYLSVL